MTVVFFCLGKCVSVLKLLCLTYVSNTIWNIVAQNHELREFPMTGWPLGPLKYNKKIVVICYVVITHAVRGGFVRSIPIYHHYNDVMMSAMTSQLTGVSIVYSTGCSAADQRKHQRPALLVFVRGIHRWPLNSSHKRLITWKMFSFDYVIMVRCWYYSGSPNTKWYRRSNPHISG